MKEMSFKSGVKGKLTGKLGVCNEVEAVIGDRVKVVSVMR